MPRMTREARSRVAAIDARRAIARIALALLLGATASVLVALRAHAGADRARDRSVREALAGYSFHTLDGRATSLEALHGEVVVINLWASWCGPCRKELPELEALHGEIAKKGGRVLAVSIDLEPRNVERFVRKLGLMLPVYHDGQSSLARRLDLKGVPYTVVLDRAGEVAFTSQGAEPGEIERLRSVTRALVASRPVVARANEGE